MDSNILHSIFGVLGGLGMLTGFQNAAAVDEYWSKLAANPEALQKFLEGGQYALAGTVLQRHLVKTLNLRDALGWASWRPCGICMAPTNP